MQELYAYMIFTLNVDINAFLKRKKRPIINEDNFIFVPESASQNSYHYLPPIFEDEDAN